jgi:hypothetical protein
VHKYWWEYQVTRQIKIKIWMLKWP